MAPSHMEMTHRRGGLFTERSDNSLLVCGHSFLIRIMRVMLKQACFSVFVNQILSLTTWRHIQHCHLLYSATRSSAKVGFLSWGKYRRQSYYFSPFFAFFFDSQLSHATINAYDLKCIIGKKNGKAFNSIS